ncbi:hypothetical protein EN46_06755 [Citrobacter amalonaticus]
MNTFEGFSLEPVDAFSNINLLIEAGMLLTASTNEGTEELGDIVLDMAKKYSRAASQKDVYEKKSATQLAPTPSPCPSVEVSSVTIGERILGMRNLREMTSAALAKSVDVQPTLIAMWESGATEPRAKHIIPLANALKCDPIWLLTGNPADVKSAQPAPQPAPVNVMKGADLANIGVRIESLRNRQGMSTPELAERTGTSWAMILEWETGEAIPPSEYVDKLAKALNTTVTWLMSGKVINDAGIK